MINPEPLRPLHHRPVSDLGRTVSRLLVACTICIGAASAASPALAASDPIDDALNSCLSSRAGQTTSGMLDCTRSAYAAYDRRLNAEYQRVMTQLDPRSQALLRASQRQWVAFRAAEHGAMNGPWSATRGSLVSLDIAAADVDAIKERIRELKLYG